MRGACVHAAHTHQRRHHRYAPGQRYCLLCGVLQAYTRAGKYDANEYGLAFLKQNKQVESLDVKIINPYAPFEYKKDYDVGDIVKVVSEDYGVEITHNILEVTEFWDSTGFHLYIVFGDFSVTYHATC